MNDSPSVQIGFCWSFPEVTPEEGLPRLRAHGIEGIELWPQYLDAFGAERWAEVLRASGMRCFQLCPYFDFVHGAEKLRVSRQMLRDYLKAARTLNCKRVRVFTGPPWGEGVVGAHEATEAQWQAAIAGLREFGEVAAREGVELCLECHEGSLMEDSPNALRLIRAVNRPNLTANLQLPLRNEDWNTSLKALGPFTTHIHIHNWTGGCGVGDLTFVSEGVFDWRTVVRYLVKDCGRKVCLSLEHVDHGGKHDPWQTAEKDGAYLRRLREQL